MSKPFRTNNYKLRIFNKCPKCNSNLNIEHNLSISFFMYKKIKDFAWKKFFLKSDKDSGSYNYDYNINNSSTILISDCGNYIDTKKNPQREKIRIKKLFEDNRQSTKTTCSHIYCENCVYSVFIENTSYLDILKEKICQEK